jgi:predicted Zn finger-like uncharacterized protein
MITYCPACRTHFRVHAEQLAARAGQVRCGKCSRPFNALEHLLEEEAPSYGSGAMRAEPATAKHLPEPARTDAADASFKTPEAAEPFPADAAAVEIPPPPIEAAESAPFKIKETPAAPAFDFGPSAAPGKPVRRWPWLLGALPLLALLLAQAAYHYRSAIVLLWPEAKPYAVALCATLGCELPLPRRVELMSIEASDLQADITNPNVMVLLATLKNRAIFNQQYPVLELTLTDAQDQPLVRRVLAPQDYIGKSVNAQAGFAANTEIAIKVFIESSQVKATGYRLYLFYP